MKDEKQQSFYFRSGSTFTADLDFVKMKNEDIWFMKYSKNITSDGFSTFIKVRFLKGT